MKLPLAVPLHTTLRDVAEWTTRAFSSIVAGWNVNHNADGSHKFPWVDLPFSANRYTCSGSMTWTVDASDQQMLAYRYLTPTELLMAWNIRYTDIGGVVNTELRIALPENVKAKTYATNPHWYRDAGTEGVGFAGVLPGDSFIRLYKLGSGNWTATTSDNTDTQGSLVIRVE